MKDSGGLRNPVTDTASPGTAIHTVTSDSGAYEEVWLEANNVGSAPVALTLVLAHGTDVRELRMGISAGDGLYLILPGNAYRDGVVISAYVPSGHESDILIGGFVNQVNP